MRKCESGFRKQLVYKIADFHAKNNLDSLPRKVKERLRDNVANYDGGHYYRCNSSQLYSLL